MLIHICPLKIGDNRMERQPLSRSLFPAALIAETSTTMWPPRCRLTGTASWRS